MNAIGGEKPVLDALPEAVLVNRIAEVSVGVAVVFTQWRGRHPELVGRLEVLEDFPPAALIAGTAAVALVHDDEVEEVRRELPV